MKNTRLYLYTIIVISIAFVAGCLVVPQGRQVEDTPALDPAKEDRKEELFSVSAATESAQLQTTEKKKCTNPPCLFLPEHWRWQKYTNAKLGIEFQYPGYLEVTRVSASDASKKGGWISIVNPSFERHRMGITVNPEDLNFDSYTVDYVYATREGKDGHLLLLSAPITSKNALARYSLPESYEQNDFEVVIVVNATHSSGRRLVLSTRFPENQQHDLESHFRTFVESVRFAN